jgi:cyclophilin family peptidyl-prolyl cis-trans isomerase
LPVYLLLPELKRTAALLLLGPLAASARDGRLPDGMYAEISTPRGAITCVLEYAKAPLAVTSFVGLAEGTLGPAPRKPFFDGLWFHRVVPGFVIQGGDPLGTGDGGPGYAFPDEFGPGLSHDSAGVLSMANDGPDTNGSQFFITLAPAGRLDYLHSVFGRTVRGLDVLPKVVQGDAMRVRILRIGAAAQAFRADDATFRERVARTPGYGSEREPGPKAHFDDPDKLLPSDPPRARNFNFKLNNVERATGTRITARVFARFAPGPGADTPGAFADGLARALGDEGNGALAIYFADKDEWILWVGKSLVRRFTGLPGDPQDLISNGSLMKAKKAFLAESRVRAARYAAQSAAILPNILQTDSRRIKLSADAMLDGLIGKLALP